MNRWSKRYLYKLTFPNGMVYIGCTYDIKQRWAGKGAHYYGMKVYEAIKEFGWDNIKKEILLFLPDENGNSEKITSLEKEFIKAYSGRCYNSMSDPEWYEENPAYSKERYAPRIYWTAFGETKPAKDWCAEYNTSSSVVMNRIKKYGLTIKQALTFPPVPRGKRSKGYKVEDFWRECGLLG